MKRLSLKDQLIVITLKNIQDYINMALVGEKDGERISQTDKLKFLFAAHDIAGELAEEIKRGVHIDL